MWAHFHKTNWQYLGQKQKGLFEKSCFLSQIRTLYVELSPTWSKSVRYTRHFRTCLPQSDAYSVRIWDRRAKTLRIVYGFRRGNPFFRKRPFLQHNDHQTRARRAPKSSPEGSKTCRNKKKTTFQRRQGARSSEGILSIVRFALNALEEGFVSRKSVGGTPRRGATKPPNRIFCRVGRIPDDHVQRVKNVKCVFVVVF